MKGVEKIKLIQAYALPLQLKKKFFKEEDLALFLQWMKDCRIFRGLGPVASIHSKENWTVHPGPELQEVMELFFRTKISPTIPPPLGYEIEYKFAFHGNFSGYGIHTDAGYEPEEIIFQQGIIPLNIYPKSSQVHTVIMNQQCYHSSAFPCIAKDEVLQNQVLGLKFDDEETQKNYSKYWEDSKFRKEQINGFTIQHPFLWELGDTVIWHRSYIHCSSDFIVSQTNYKEGLMWISQLVPLAET